jgi:tight adherence protein B
VTAETAAGKAAKAIEVKFAPSSVATSGLRVPALTTRPLVLLAVLVFGVLLLATLFVISGIAASTRRRRLKQVEQFRLTGRGSRGSGQTFPQRAEGGFARAVMALTGRAKARDAEQEQAHHRELTGLAMPTRRWLVRGGSGFLGAVVLGLLGGLIGVLLGALVGGLIAELYPRLVEQRRRRAFADQLPDALQLIVGSLRSGFSLAQAIDAVVQDSVPSPLTVELGRAMGEVRLGAELDDALERAAQRAGNDDLAWAVMAVRIQRDTGGNLAEVLETTVDTLRERDRLRRHVRALSAEGRLSAYILIALPFVLAAWLLLVRRDYLRTLWTTSAGLMMLAGAAVLMAIGIFWMTRWMKVEV